MGSLGPLAPERKNDLAKIAFRAMIAGSMATFSSACVAGRYCPLLVIQLFLIILFLRYNILLQHITYNILHTYNIQPEIISMTYYNSVKFFIQYKITFESTSNKYLIAVVPSQDS